MMGTVLSSVFFFIVAIGVLVTIHEFGHFFVARRLGVRVLRFSVGFGRPLLRWQRKGDDTEYVIAALPLGGYVQMLDEREGPVPEHDLHRAFNRQSLGRRAAIVAAGPIANFLLAIAAYWLVFVIGIAGVKPVVGEVQADSLAAAGGFRSGDLIVSVEGAPVATWSAAFMSLLDNSLAGRKVEVEVLDEEQAPRSRTLDFARLAAGVDRSNLLPNIGFDLYQPVLPAIVGQLEAGGVAERAGLRTGDRLRSVEGRALETWEEWVQEVRARPEQELRIEVEREGSVVPLSIRPARVETAEGVIGRIGAAVSVPADLMERMRAVERYSPGAGLLAALERTWDMTRTTVNILVSMVIGHVSVSNLSGPIRIAQYAGYSADAGLVQFISFLAIISISLGVLNLLPVPVLDGGHLFYYLIEFVRGRPLSDEAQLVGQKIGVFMLIGVMILAFYNDIVQLIA